MIDLLNERRDVIRKHEEMKGKEVTGSPCVYELSKFTQFDLPELFSHNKVLSFTVMDAEAAGNIYYQLSREGETPAEIDAIIAGMVKNRGLVLVTRDKDFQKIKEVIEEIEVDIYGSG